MSFELAALGGWVLKLLLLVGVCVTDLQLGAVAKRLSMIFGNDLLADLMRLHTV
jgi:hypothetical protein